MILHSNRTEPHEMRSGETPLCWSAKHGTAIWTGLSPSNLLASGSRFVSRCSSGHANER